MGWNSLHLVAGRDPRELPIFDPRKVPENCADDYELFHVFAAGFLEDHAKSHLKLDQAMQATDSDGVLHLSHALKSSALILGGLHFADLCRQIETAALRGDLATVARLQPRFAPALADLCTVLAGILRPD